MVALVAAVVAVGGLEGGADRAAGHQGLAAGRSVRGGACEAGEVGVRGNNLRYHVGGSSGMDGAVDL